MSIKSFLVVCAAFLAPVSFAQTAQPSLGTVGNVQGLVTDTDGASVTSTSPGEVIHDGERFVTSSSGSVTLQLNNGCNITLQPGQAITIHKNMTCRELIAGIEPVEGVGAGAGLGRFVAAGSPAAGLLAISALSVAGFAVHRAFDKNPNVSGF